MSTTELLALAIKGSIFLTVLGLGLAATWRDATFLLREPWLLVRSMVAMFVTMPVVVGVVAQLFDLPLVVKAALVALAIAPVPPVLPKKELKAGGHAGYATGLLVLSALIAMVYVPFALAVFDWIFGRVGAISPVTIAKIVLISVLVPLALGIAVRHFAPAVAEKASSPMLTAGSLLLVIGCAPLLFATWPAVHSLFGNGTVLIIAAVAALGLAIGHALGGPVDSDRTVLALSTASRHPAIALAVATSGVLEAKPELAAILLYLLVAALISVPYTIWRRRASAARPVGDGGAH